MRAQPTGETESHDPGDWVVALDLGADTRATENDALYVQSALESAGVKTMFVPWPPTGETLTPLGAVRPLKLLVRPEKAAQAAEFVEDVLAGRSERQEVTVPVDDAWVTWHHARVGLLQLKKAAVERGGVWRWSFEVLRVVFLFMVVFTVAGALAAAVRGIAELLR